MVDLFTDPTVSKVKDNAELDRIIRLPRRTWQDTDTSWLNDTLKTPGGTMQLRPIQASALFEIGTEGGLFAPIRVGGGKTLISLLAPVVSFAERPLLLVPAALIHKTERDEAVYSCHWELGPWIRTISYEWLGRSQAAEELEQWQPDLIIADEVHRLKNPQAAVTRRVRRYMLGHPETKFVAMSGTITKRSLHDYAHILRWCLRPGDAPLPRGYNDLELWADALDERKRQLKRAHPGALSRLCDEEEMTVWNRGDERRAARMAFRRRLRDTPGIVASDETPIDASITIKAVELQLSAPVDEAFHTLRKKWETPDGWPVADGLSMFRHAREIALGFYYVWHRHEGFTECLEKTLQHEKNTIGNIERRILSACARTTEKDIALEKAVVLLKSTKPEKGRGISRPDTDSLSSNTTDCSPNSTELVTFASGERSQEMAGGVDISQLITITQQAKLEGCSVSSATGRLECWVTLLRAFPRLLSIFKTASRAARPPRGWLEPRKAWATFVRKVLNGSRHLDSESQVRKEHEDTKECQDWLAVRDTYKPNTVPVWISDEVIHACIKWMEKNPGIVWTEHTCFAERLSLLSGVPYYGRQGLNADGLAIEGADTDKPLIASVASNSTGRNLQAWSKNLITSIPANGMQAEQLMGRTHRDGQEADNVTFDVLVTCAEHVGAFYQAMKDSRYVADSTGAPQKILLADVDMLTATDVVGRRGACWDKAI